MHFKTAILGALVLCASGAFGLSSAHADTGSDHIAFSHTFGGKAAYDYSPTMVQSNGVQHFYWCGYDKAGTNFDSDTILTQSYNTFTGEKSAVSVALTPTSGKWDKQYTCNPSVIMGTFVDPLHNGKTYSIALYYVGSENVQGVHNSIGVAFSNDWHHFTKAPGPVLSPPTSCHGYGIGQPSAYNADGRSRIWLFYSDPCTKPASYQRAQTTDGVRFHGDGHITYRGLTADGKTATQAPSNASLAYDTRGHEWYMAGQYVDRRVGERASFGFGLYRIPAAGLMTGTKPWQQLSTVDTNLTGHEVNAIPTLIRDAYGNLNLAGLFPDIEMAFEVGGRAPARSTLAADSVLAGPTHWDIAEITWHAGNPMVPFNRYFSTSLDRSEATTGYVDRGVFRYQMNLAYLYEAPNSRATRALYGCRNGSDDYFVSPAANCEGKKVLGLEGYAVPPNGDGTGLSALYRCDSGKYHFVSLDPHCEGHTREMLLGYGFDPMRAYPGLGAASVVTSATARG